VLCNFARLAVRFSKVEIWIDGALQRFGAYTGKPQPDPNTVSECNHVLSAISLVRGFQALNRVLLDCPDYPMHTGPGRIRSCTPSPIRLLYSKKHYAFLGHGLLNTLGAVSPAKASAHHCIVNRHENSFHSLPENRNTDARSRSRRRENFHKNRFELCGLRGA